MMRRSMWIFLVSAMALCASFAAQARLIPMPERELTLYVGEARVIAIPPVTRVAVGDGKLLSVTVVKNHQMVLLAQDAGETTVHLWARDGRQATVTVHIALANIVRVLHNVRDMLGDVRGLKIQAVGDHVVIDGRGLGATDLRFVAQVQKLYPQVVSFVRPAEVRMKRMIYMKVRIMEFDKQALNNLGIEWQNVINGPAFGVLGDLYANGVYRILPSPALAPSFQFYQNQLPLHATNFRNYAGITSELDSVIHLLESSGKAYKLASPELSTRSGGTATFLAGGEIPLPVVSTLGQASVTFKQYGIRLNIQPVADSHGNILARLKTEVSNIDPSVTVQGIPGFLTRRTEAEINCHDGQTIVISGLVSATADEQLTKFPWLGDVPILGELFRSRKFQANRTDLVIFVTPHVVDANSPRNLKAIRKSDRLLKAFKQSLGRGIVD